MPTKRLWSTDAIVLSRFDLGEADRVLTLITPARRQDQRDRQGRPAADEPARWQRRAVRRAAPPAGPRPDLRRRHPGQRRPCLAGPARLARVDGHGLVPGRAGRALDRGAPPGRAALHAAQAGLRAARRRDAAGPGRPLVRDAPGRRAGHAARGRPLRRVRPDARAGATRSAGCRRSAACSASATRDRRPSGPASASTALKLLKAYQRLDIEALAALRVPARAEREVEAAMRDFVRFSLERDARSLAFLDEVRVGPGRRPARSTPDPALAVEARR